MKKNERTKFATIIGSTAELYNRTLTDAALELWWNALSDLPLAEIEQGISRHLRDPERGRFMPAPADVRAACGMHKPLASIAWGQVLDTMESSGAYASVLFEDGVTNAVIRDLGGWPHVCHRQATDDDPVWLQKDFERRYDDYSVAGRIERTALMGLHEEINRNGGYSECVSEPRYIASSQLVSPKLIAPKNTPQLTPPKPEPSGPNGGGLTQIGELLKLEFD